MGVRAFITSQSAEAHFILFKRIFEIAEKDTNKPVRFLHIHGEGFYTWIADAHMGQALGTSLLCYQYISLLSQTNWAQCASNLKVLGCIANSYVHPWKGFAAASLVEHFAR